MAARRTTLLLAVLVLPVGAEEWTTSRSGSSWEVIDTPHLHAVVPAGCGAALRPTIERADGIYVRLAADAGYAIKQPLTLWLSDDVDSHNGFSTTVPRPLIEIDLAPAPPRNGLFTGGNLVERTLVHELTHHISNDQPHGVQEWAGRIFGRVYPSEPLSLLAGYLTVPSHVTMPSFWHEGIAQWAETAYSDPASPWGGRGRDPLTHMVWRLDAAAGSIPEPSEWRADHPWWPFGNRVYLYGLAYTRWLEGRFGRNPGMWAIIDRQTRGWPFLFDRMQRGFLDPAGHQRLIERARADLLSEQQAQLALIRSVPVTAIRRLTPVDTLPGAPAWLPGGRLLAAYDDPWGTARLVSIDGTGAITDAEGPGFDRGEVRSLPDGTAVYAEAHGRRSRLRLRLPDGSVHELPGDRLLQPDLRRNTDALDLACIRLLIGGGQELMVGGCAADGSAVQPWRTVAVTGTPWSPAFRPGHDELSWIECDNGGSQLVLAPLSDPSRRTILARVAGRLMHPSWTADGKRVYLCADHTGVANAWYIDVEGTPTLHPVTNVIGGVTACVPSPDGNDLAVVAFDGHGPYLGKISGKTADFPASIPTIACSWPAPSAIPGADGGLAGPIRGPVVPAGPVASSEPVPYHGPAELQFQFWTPTTLVTRYGGLGVQTLIADPLATTEIVLGAGVGDVEHRPVAAAALTWEPSVIGVSVAAWRAERTWTDQVVDSRLNRYDYSETSTTGEIRLGSGLIGRERRLTASIAAGITREAAVDRSRDRYSGQRIISSDPFEGSERYGEAVLGYASTIAYPTSYASREDGPEVLALWHQGGFGGSLQRRYLSASAAWTVSHLPRLGHQLVGVAYSGWSASDGQQTLQGDFAIGGANNPLTPRGYPSNVASGPYLIGWSAAYRLPLWRPFTGAGTTPFGFRQLVLEPFLDGGQVSSDHLHGNGRWYRSAGGELVADGSVWALRLNPALGVAQQLDGAEDATVYLRIGFRW